MPPVTQNTSLLQAIASLANQPGTPAHARAKAGVVRPTGIERTKIEKPIEPEVNPKAVRGSYLDIVV